MTEYDPNFIAKKTYYQVGRKAAAFLIIRFNA